MNKEHIYLLKIVAHFRLIIIHGRCVPSWIWYHMIVLLIVLKQPFYCFKISKSVIHSERCTYDQFLSWVGPCMNSKWEVSCKYLHETLSRRKFGNLIKYRYITYRGMRLYGKIILKHDLALRWLYRVFNQHKKYMVSMNVLPLYYIATIFLFIPSSRFVCLLSFACSSDF